MNQETKYFQNKKVLVTGGTGFIGTNLVKALLSLGALIRATIYQRDENNPRIFDERNEKPRVFDERIKYVKCDLTKREDCQKIVKDIDYVFMAAANTSGAAVVEKTPLAHLTPNLIMNALMLEAAYEAGVKKFLFTSSNSVYPDSDQPVKEDDMRYGDVFSKYYFVAWMKQFSEVLCEMYTKVKNPMKTIVIRPANTFGPYDDFEWETSHVLPALIRKVVERHNPIEIWGDGSDVKDFIYVEDLAKGMILAMEKIESFCQLSIATGRPCTVKEAFDAMLVADNYQDAKVVFNTSKPVMIPKRLIDPSKAKELLGFEAKTSLAEGIKKTIDWYKQNQC